jgi:hypothetical protein
MLNIAFRSAVRGQESVSALRTPALVVFSIKLLLTGPVEQFARVTVPDTVNTTVPPVPITMVTGAAEVAVPHPVPTAVPSATAIDPAPSSHNVYVPAGIEGEVCEAGVAEFRK